MRSLAQLQLAQDPAARAAMEEQFDMGGDEDDEETQRQEVSAFGRCGFKGDRKQHGENDCLTLSMTV